MRAVLIVAACVAVAGVTHVIRGQFQHAVSDDFKEFTMVRSETSVSRGQYGMQRVVFEAQRADGSRVTGDVLPPGDSKNAARRMITLIPERMHTKVNDGLRSKTTYYFKDRPAPRPPAADPQCGFSRLAASTNPALMGEAEVSGFRTVAIQTEQRIADESFLRTEWRALDLDCAVLKLVEERRDDSGHTTGHFEIQAVKITVGTPDPKLFQVPEDYSEKSPSEMYKALIAKFAKPGRPILDSMRRTLERDDQQYSANRQAAGIE
jgi:hypothetical protein